MNLRHIFLITTLATFSIFAIGCSTAGEPYSAGQTDAGSGSTGAQPNELAYDGNDPVAYFAVEKATKGVPELSLVRNGVRYLFSNKENLERFTVEPSRYLAQFDSHCPVSLSNGNRDYGKPSAWRVFKDRLYFFASEGLARSFDESPDEIIEKAKGEWERENTK